MNNFKLHTEAQQLADIHSNYKLARRYLETKEDLSNLKQKYEDLNKITEDLLKTNKVLQDAVESLQEIKEDLELEYWADEWRNTV